MPTWNLHIVANKPMENVDQIAADIADVLTSADHEVTSMVLTTDEGSVDVTPAPVAAEEEEPAPDAEEEATPATDTESPQPPAEVPQDTPPT